MKYYVKNAAALKALGFNMQTRGGENCGKYVKVLSCGREASYLFVAFYVIGRGYELVLETETTHDLSAQEKELGYHDEIYSAAESFYERYAAVVTSEDVTAVRDGEEVA